jgi:SAM-dependent MidA family methyltransferase
VSEIVEPFSDFMQRALHDPVRGYYARQITGVGQRGDFSTSATISNHLAKAIASWIKEVSARHPHVKTVIEVGGGTGVLLSSVIRSTGWWTRRRLRFAMVDSSPKLREQQQARPDLRHITWHERLEEALDACDGHAFIFHNELLDAFPVTLLEWQHGKNEWQEIHVRSLRGQIVAEERHAFTPERGHPLALRDIFTALQSWDATHPPPQKNQRIELALPVHDWLRHWSPRWKSGSMLTLDYGDLFPAIYHRRPAGTLRAYSMHQRLQGAAIYQNPGRQDITADVNFSDLRAWCRTLGWREDAYLSQAEFFARQGLEPEDQGDRYLSDPGGAGGAFRCLIVSKG